ncbi:MAG TPA: penicillin-binding protein 1C, partial [Bacillota bacterium]|nr:penicillin-binding protein 1C [Bacillota bacterium]
SAWIIPLPSEALNRPSSTLIFARDGQLLHAFISSDDMWRIQTPLSQISPELQKALLGFEDRWFYLHPGVNPIALGRALLQNIASRKIISGGSTLTMQIARMMEPKKRNLGNKLWEILRAFQLELRYSKRRLLEIYFNIAPYGGNIEGVAAAAWIYFGKEPSQLSLGEAALLTVIPNSPNAYRPDLNPKRSRKGRNALLTRLLKLKFISKKAYQEAVAEEISDAKVELPRIAPHFCRDLYLKYSEVPRLTTTLDRKYQSVAEDLLRLHLNDLRSEGITNGAIIILDNRSHEVLAMVGSGDFNDRAHDGQVNAVFAPRSPGSALKPFIYAQAIYIGLVSPGHYLEDVPTDFSGYAPENYDRSFSGMVSVRSALERSLNLPAVELESRLGDQDLYSILRRAGVSTIRSRKDYGLSIAIGGCEVNLFDLTTLYSSFANKGIYIRPRQLKTESETAGLRIFDPGTAYLITDILTGLRRPDLPTCWEFTSLPRVAWKTGTSYGHRDAWSIGYNPLYTVGVWLGNFSGQGAPNLIGAEVATPILFELMNYLNRNHSTSWFTQPDSVGVRRVCSLSGQLPSPNCPTLMEELYLVDRSPDRVCECHQSVLIDNATGCRLPPDYPVLRKSHLQKFIQWPPRVGAWMESSGYEVKRLPPLLPGWQGLLPGQPPIIRSPSLDCEYRLREGIPAEFQKICCEASAGSEVQKLYWFIDGLLLGTVKPGERLFYIPTPGRHRVVCQDDLGRQTEIKLMIGKAE